MMLTSTSTADEWRRRLLVPNYQVAEAARYAEISPRTVVDWHKNSNRRTLSAREKRAALSYMQLIEVAVVAAFRKAGVPLQHVKAAREYMGKQFQSEYPFAEYSFKTDGQRLFVDYEEVAGPNGKGKLIRPDRNGQLAWDSIIGRLSEFDYERKGIVVRWHLHGHDSPIAIDPRVAFGAPAVRGTPTWVLRGRWDAGELVDEIAGDFGLKSTEIIRALEFEGVDLSGERKVSWKH
jgi:uncharacterized protein (DUF433 family)